MNRRIKCRKTSPRVLLLRTHKYHNYHLHRFVWVNSPLSIQVSIGITLDMGVSENATHTKKGEMQLYIAGVSSSASSLSWESQTLK